MIIFVSYSRRDNDAAALQRIERLVFAKGRPYIDDIHHHTYGSHRHEIVIEALHAAEAFVAVVSPHYLRTPWTRKEFGVARRRRIPMSALLPDGTFVDIWSREWFMQSWSAYRQRDPSHRVLAAQPSLGRLLTAPTLLRPAADTRPSG